MQYPSMGKSRQYRVTIPQLNGGVNYAVPSHLVNDNQLSDISNMWYKDGCLRTRPCFVESGDGVLDIQREFVKNPDFGEVKELKPISTTEVKGKICVTSICKTEKNDITNAFLIFSFYDTTGQYIKSFPKHVANSDETDAVFVIGNATDNHNNADVLALLSEGDAVSILSVFADGDTVQEDNEPYIPTILKGGEPSEEKTYGFNDASMFEPPNLLTDSFCCKYLSNGKGIYFSLHKQDLKLNEGDEITVEHITSSGMYEHVIEITEGGKGEYAEATAQGDGARLIFESKSGIFYFKNGDTPESPHYALPLTHVDDNVTFTLRTKAANNAKTISDMRFSIWFGGGSSGLTSGTRLFVSGNPDHPNLMHWSALNNPLYFPENNYAEVGDNNQAITAFGRQSELLVVFKERELYCSYYAQGTTPTSDQLQSQQVIDIEAAQAVFPIYPLHPSVGCECPDTIRLCNNRLVWFSGDMKVYGLFTTGQYSERNVRELSRPIEKLLQEDTSVREAMMNAVATECQNHYLLHIGNRVFVMDYSSYGFTYFSSYSSDEKMAKAVTWYVWETDFSDDVTLVSANDGYNTPLYVVQRDSQYHILVLDSKGLSDAFGGCIVSKFRTKLFDFGHPERLKRVNPLYLQVSGTAGKTLKITYFRDNGKVLDDYAPMLTGRELENETPIRISTNATRVREFGIELQSDGRMAVGSITLNYSMMGTVR